MAFFFWSLVVLGLPGCTGTGIWKNGPNTREFDFARDTFAYTNQLHWAYGYDTNGNWTWRKESPPPSYALHCFVMARATRQFFYFSEFQPEAPKLSQEEYRSAIRQITAKNPRTLPSSPRQKVIIPGYSGLREFSAEFEPLLKAECGGAWESYVQRSHWRMVFPISRRHQQRTADSLLKAVAQKHIPVVHLVEFPKLKLNHAAVVFQAEDRGEKIVFKLYDPNNVSVPIELFFNRAERRFYFPATHYYPGGRIKVIEIFRDFCH